MTTITIDRALLEQTLQALVRTYHYGGVIAADAECITALRAALAQQQAKPQGCDHCNHPLYAATKCRVCGRVTEQAEPLEPVGWNWMLDGQPYGQAYYGNPPDTDIAERAAIAGRTVRLLYTAPPQRKPLTDEEINETAQTNLGDYRDGEWHLLFARAIERAHGITGDPK